MKLAALLIAGATLASSIVAPAWAQEIPSLVGTWKGESDGIGQQQGWVKGPAVLEVSEQRGRSFRAKVTYVGDNGNSTENVLGTITPDGKNVYLVGDDGIQLASLNGEFLDSCYLEADDDDAKAVCIRFKK